jgi:2,3-bisphosphoglycerate-dependent phosphoglycerate mutase
LADCLGRQRPYVEREVRQAVGDGAVVLLVGHGNSLRALVAQFDRVPTVAIPALLVPTAVPLVYRYQQRWRREPDIFPVRGTCTGP